MNTLRQSIARPTVIRFPSRDTAIALITALAITLAVFYSIVTVAPPAVVPASASPTQFSAERAMFHLQVIAQEPHPTGSPANAAVRAYLVEQLAALGLEPEVQQANALRHWGGGSFTGGTVYNVMARLEGTAGTGKAVMLAAHYDSTPNGPGASDDGAAVAAFLETVRALKAGTPLRNDVIVLFTDGEEQGLLGAQAFADGHPWIRDVGLVLNFEARGNGGPSVLFEVSHENGWLIREFARAAPYPEADSLGTEIINILPNNSDMSVWREAGLPGLNFAYFKGVTHYDTMMDSLQEIDPRSLQHHGSYALSLTRHFGNLNLENTGEADAVFFKPFAGAPLVNYPVAWVLPLAVLVALLYVGVVTLGRATKQLTLVSVLLGWLALLPGMIVSAVLVTVGWQILRAIHPEYTALFTQDTTYNERLYLGATVFLTLAVTTALFILTRRRLSATSLAAGALGWWLLLLALTVFALPGAAHLFTWPLLFSLLALGATFVIKAKAPNATPWVYAVVLMAGALPGIVLLAPSIPGFAGALGPSALGALMVFVVLIVGLILPLLEVVTAPSSVRWVLPIGAALVCLAFIGAGSMTAGFDTRHPHPTSVFYALDADTGTAMFGTRDTQVNAWTAAYLPATPDHSNFAQFFPPADTPILYGPAPTVPLAAPIVEVLDDTTNGQARTLRLRITSPRQAINLYLHVAPEAEPRALTINGKRVEITAEGAPADGYGLNYAGLPPEGLELTLETTPGKPVVMTVVDQSNDLPEMLAATFPERPEDTMPQPWWLGRDPTFVRVSVTIP